MRDEKVRLLSDDEQGALADAAVTEEAIIAGSHEALFEVVEGLLVDRFKRIEGVLGPASTIVIGDDAPEARYWQQGADSVVRAVRSALRTTSGQTS